MRCCQKVEFCVKRGKKEIKRSIMIKGSISHGSHLLKTVSNRWSLSCGNVPASRLMVPMEQRFQGLFVYLLVKGVLL